MELIVFTSADELSREGRIINELFSEGLEVLHIRKPGMDAGQFSKLLLEIDPEYYPAISIHQHHELAAEFSLKRLHYPEQQRKSVSYADLQALRSKGYTLSSSVHDLHVVTTVQDSARATLSCFDYVLFGPVFNSISKSGYHSMLEPGFILPPHVPKVFAIGGINAERLATLQQMNFDGAALLGALWHEKHDPVEVFKSIRKALLTVQHEDQ